MKLRTPTGRAGEVTLPDAVRLSQATRDQITTLKRRTGVKHMNVLCRWALCRSLAEPSLPAAPELDTAVEIEWKVFAGSGGSLWWVLMLMHHAQLDGMKALTTEGAAALLRAHVARGMAYLVGDPAVRDATSLVRLALAD